MKSGPAFITDARNPINMERREFLGVVGSGSMVMIAGCSGILNSAEYEEGNKDELLPDEVGSDWPDQDLESNHDFNTNFDRSFVTPEEDLFILMKAEIEETVSDAEDSYESSNATVNDPNDFPLADEAYIHDDGEVAVCLWRKSNAVGQVLAARTSGLELRPDRQRATAYAERIYAEYW